MLVCSNLFHWVFFLCSTVVFRECLYSRTHVCLFVQVAQIHETAPVLFTDTNFEGVLSIVLSLSWVLPLFVFFFMLLNSFFCLRACFFHFSFLFLLLFVCLT